MTDEQEKEVEGKLEERMVRMDLAMRAWPQKPEPEDG